MYSNTQVPFLHKREFAEILNMDPARIRIIQPPIGGGFGSKLDIYPFEPITVFLAQAPAERPVKLVFTREEEFLASPTRQPVILTLRSGCTKGRHAHLPQVNTLHDNGAYTSWGATTPFVMMQTISSLYRVPHCLYHTKAVYTNNPYAGSFRGYGNLQATFAVEAAHGHDGRGGRHGPARLPAEERAGRRRSDAAGHALQELRLEGMPDHRRRGERLPGASTKAKHRRERGKPGRFKRGIGIASMLHVGGGAKIYPSDGCGTILKIDDFALGDADHRRLRNRPGLRDGAGAQLVCEELGLPMSAVTRRQQRHRDHAVGRRCARLAHHLHRRQFGDRRGQEGTRQDPGGGGRQDGRPESGRARSARQPSSRNDKRQGG
jgi:hypothetical protein